MIHTDLPTQGHLSVASQVHRSSDGQDRRAGEEGKTDTERGKDMKEKRVGALERTQKNLETRLELMARGCWCVLGE